MEATATILIRRDQEDVFRFVSDPVNMGSWVEGIMDPVITSGGEFGRGSTFESEYTYGGRSHHIRFVVTNYDPPRCFGTRSDEGPFPFRGALFMQKDRDGTFVSNTIEAGPDGIGTQVMFTLFGPLLRRSMRKQLRKELEVLKGVLET